MGNTFGSGRQKKHTRQLYRLDSNNIQVKIVPEQKGRQSELESVSCQTQSINSQIISQNQVHTILLPMASPRSDSYSGSMQSVNSSNDISNKNVQGNKQKINDSQHVNSQVHSNFISGILTDPKKLHRITQYQSRQQTQDEPVSSITH